MSLLEDTTLRLDDFLSGSKIDYVLIGGVAAILHGIQRPTQDVDVALLLEVDSLKKIGVKILKSYLPRKENPLEFFERFFVLPVTDPVTKIDVGIAAGLGGFDRMAIRRAKPKQIKNRSIPCCTVKDLIIYKLAANRGRDLDDIDLLRELYGDTVDVRYLHATAKQFVKLERGDILERVNRLFPAK